MLYLLFFGKFLSIAHVVCVLYVHHRGRLPVSQALRHPPVCHRVETRCDGAQTHTAHGAPQRNKVERTFLRSASKTRDDCAPFDDTYSITTSSTSCSGYSPPSPPPTRTKALATAGSRKWAAEARVALFDRIKRKTFEPPLTGNKRAMIGIRRSFAPVKTMLISQRDARSMPNC